MTRNIMLAIVALALAGVAEAFIVAPVQTTHARCLSARVAPAGPVAFFGQREKAADAKGAKQNAKRQDRMASSKALAAKKAAAAKKTAADKAAAAKKATLAKANAKKAAEKAAKAKKQAALKAQQQKKAQASFTSKRREQKAAGSGGIFSKLYQGFDLYGSD